jgi:hypothetical protein
MLDKMTNEQTLLVCDKHTPQKSTEDSTQYAQVHSLSGSDVRMNHKLFHFVL